MGGTACHGWWKATWSDYWKENKRALGFPVPDTWHSTETTVLTTVSAIVGAIEKFGSRVTLAELIRAGYMTERLAVLGACSASAFAGAAIGSAEVATGRYLSAGTSIADVFAYAAPKRLLSREVRQVLARYPQIYQSGHPARAMVGLQAKRIA